MNTSITMNARNTLTIASELKIADLDGEYVVLNIDNGHYYGLNEIGARILELARENAGLHEVFEALLDEYDVAPDQLHKDVEKFLSDMEEYEMIRVEAATPA